MKQVSGQPLPRLGRRMSWEVGEELRRDREEGQRGGTERRDRGGTERRLMRNLNPCVV